MNEYAQMTYQSAASRENSRDELGLVVLFQGGDEFCHHRRIIADKGFDI
jgi:hypothetical protein